MQTYIYYAPTKLYIGNEEEHVGQIIKDLGYKNILFIYGGGSIKRNGLYDVVIKSLKDNDLNIIECGGVEGEGRKFEVDEAGLDIIGLAE